MTNLAPPLNRHPGLDPGSIPPLATTAQVEKWTLKQVQGDEHGFAVEAQKLLAISLEGSVG